MKRLSLKSLSDNALLARIVRIRRREHLSTLDILVHLNEISRRQLHLALGYSSLFDYCTKHLSYSTSAACRRIQSARCLRRHPEVYDLLRGNRLNLMTLSLVAPILTDENKATLLPRVLDKTQREVETIASEYRTPLSLRDQVRPVRVRVPDRSGKGNGTIANAEQQGTNPGEQNRTSVSDYPQTGGDIMLTRPAGEAPKPLCRIEKKLLIQFLADEAFMEKYKEVRALLSQRLADRSFEKVFEALIEEFLERHSPSRRKARRDKRESAKAARKEQAKNERTKTEHDEKAQTKAAKQPKKPSRPDNPRHISIALRDRVFERDGGRCTYVGKTGERCGCTHALQIDHIRPVSRGGLNEPSNLRLLCAKHNRLAAEELFGKPFIKHVRERE